MVAISKYDKKVWKNYVSNFEKTVLCLNNEKLTKVKSNKSKFVSRSGNSLDQKHKIKKNKLNPDKILDLHGHTLYSARLLLNKSISNCYEKNIRNILIITGKGQNNKGLLKEEVPRWLSDKFLNRFLVNFNLAPKHFGGEGALLVRIKNRYK